MLEAVMQRVLKQFKLDSRERILVKLQLGFDRGHLVLDQPVAFRADAAKFIVKADRIEPADLAVIEQLFDVGEVEVGMVRQRFLFLVRRGGADHQVLFVADHVGLAAPATRRYARRETAPKGHRTTAPCFLPRSSVRARSRC